MSQPLSFGVLGTGNIAKQFAAGVKTAKRSRVVSVGSRNKSSADDYAAAYGLAAAYGDYESVLRDPAVQAVYISLPNSMHHEWTLKTIAAGKHALCEKPIGMNAGEAEEMFDAAEKAGVVLMEAFMYRCHPQTIAVLTAVRDGAIGELRMIRSSFCYRTNRIAGNIRYDASLGGGALMDIGCYCINLSRTVAAAEPIAMHAVGELHKSGIDQSAAVVMQFPNNVMASFTIGMNLQVDNTAYISGSDGYIEIPVPWKPPITNAVWHLAKSTPPKMDQLKSTSSAAPPLQTFTADTGGVELFGVEADAFAACVFDQAPVPVTREDSVGNMRVLDTLRTQLGVH